MVFNLAPLSTRRDIAMLGVLHRTALGLGPSHLLRFFEKHAPLDQHQTRRASRRHPRQLKDPRKGAYPELLRRSALGLVAVYNLLPADVALEHSVAAFQKKLQQLVKARAAAGCEDWVLTFSPRVLSGDTL